MSDDYLENRAVAKFKVVYKSSSRNHDDATRKAVESVVRLVKEAARADAFREGMEAAAGIVEQYLTDHGYLVGAYGMVREIRDTAERPLLAAASEHVKVCVWVTTRNNMSSTKCGNGFARLFLGMKFCPYCGKPISVREG